MTRSPAEIAAQLRDVLDGSKYHFALGEETCGCFLHARQLLDELDEALSEQAERIQVLVAAHERDLVLRSIIAETT